MATSPASLPYGTPLTGSNATSWADAILAALGAPATAANVTSLTDWFALEGGGGQNNPLNTTMSGAGSTGAINSAGVQGFATPAEGVAATVKTLDQPVFSSIKAALKSGQGLVGNKQIAGALAAWSGGGYSAIGAPAGGTVKGIQGTVPGVSAPGSAPSGADNTNTISGTGPDPNAPGGIIGFAERLPVIGGLARAVEPLLHAVATVIDYSFAMFQPGQAQRALFAAGALVLAFAAYRVLASSGTLPKPAVLP